jgi:anaphase-promoting complex subunit 8
MNSVSINDVKKLKTSLRQAVNDLNIRGLHFSAKWACEQLMGINDLIPNEHMEVPAMASQEKMSSVEYDLILFANSLLSNGEYQRCANLMRNKSKFISSSIGTFINFYSLYMAGEKIKEQSISEGSEKLNKIYVKNPFLSDLFHETLSYYNENRMDGFLLYLFGIIVRDLRTQGNEV